MRELGVDVQKSSDAFYTVYGVGLHGLRAPDKNIECGNSGTAMRLLAGVLAGQPFESRLTGDASLSRRPMRRIADPLNEMGARIETTADGTPPLRINGGSLSAIDYALPMPSAQVKSAILLAGLFAEGETRVIESGVSRDHTERMLPEFGVAVTRGDGAVSVSAPERMRTPGRIDIPGDLSSAAFLLAAAAMRPGASLLLEGVGINPTRNGILSLLGRMGAAIQIENFEMQQGELVANLRITGGNLRGINISAADVALAVDEIPVVLAVAAIAEGKTEVRGAGELKVKESDRLTAMVEGLERLGITAELLDDGVRVFGGQPRGGVIDSHGDHRVAMSFAILGQRAKGPVEIRDCENIETSFPGFVALMQCAGLDISEKAP